MARRSEAGLQSFREKMAAASEYRLDVICDLFRKVAPMGRENVTPKAVVFRQAVEYYQANSADLREEPWFETHKDFFINEGYMHNQWSEIVHNLSDSGVTVCTQNGRHGGIFLSGKKADIEATFAHKDAVIKGSTEKRNYLAENANHKRYISLPLVNLRFYLPSVTQSD